MRTLGLMADSRWDSQPTQLAHAPKAYPSHDFKGTGTIWQVYLNDVLLGRLSYTGFLAKNVLWQPTDGLDDVSFEYSNAITMALYEGAQVDTPLPEVLGRIYGTNKVQVIPSADLGGLRP